jgi:hypothetical protein
MSTINITNSTVASVPVSPKVVELSFIYPNMRTNTVK